MKLKSTSLVGALIIFLLYPGGPVLSGEVADNSAGYEGFSLDTEVIYSKSGKTLDLLYPKEKPKEAWPVIVWIHGGGWQAGDKRRGVRNLLPFARHGYVCVTISYRLVEEAVFPAQIHDCKAAIRYLRAHADKYGIDPDRIGVWGASAGGHLAALLGASDGIPELEGDEGWPGYSSGVQAVCDWYGPTDLLSANEHAPGDERPAQLLGGEVRRNRELASLASPISHITEDDPPFLIMHGRRDDVVPLKQSRLLKWALKRQGVPVELVIVKGAGHGGDKFKTSKIEAKVEAFFDRYLKNPPSGSPRDSGRRGR